MPLYFFLLTFCTLTIKISYFQLCKYEDARYKLMFFHFTKYKGLLRTRIDNKYVYIVLSFYTLFLLRMNYLQKLKISVANNSDIMWLTSLKCILKCDILRFDKGCIFMSKYRKKHIIKQIQQFHYKNTI